MQMIRPVELRVIPGERFSQLQDSRRPPTDVRVWLARQQDGNAMHDALNEFRIAGAGPPLPGFFSMLAFGHLVILVAGGLAPGPGRLRIGHKVDERVTSQLWPASSRPAAWPPDDPIGDLDPKTVITKL